MSDANPIPKSGSFFNKKIGALPLWAYAAILFAMVLGYYYYTKHKTSGTTLNTLSTNGDPNATGDGTTNAAGFMNNGGTSSFQSVGNSNTGSASPTNAIWGENAANYLIGTGVDPTAAENAVANYLGGQNLSASDTTLIRQALAAEGTPPQGVIPAATSQAVQPSITYQVTAGDSLVSIAKAFYGDANKWSEIYNANVQVVGPDPLALHHGEILTLPGDGLLATPNSRIPSNQAVPTSHVYTTQYGDTGIQIAEKFYGDPTAWDKIYQLNKAKLPNPNEIPAGTVLQLP